MLELPEVLTIAGQLGKQVRNKKISRVLPPSKEHKFCWYHGEPGEYQEKIKDSEILSVEGFGIFVEIVFSNGYKLCFNDGVNTRVLPSSDIPKNYQLVIEFHDGWSLVFTVAMYGGIILHDDNYDNEYYVKSRYALLPFDEKFPEFYHKLWEESKPSLSAKAFLATKQRFPGIGNGVLQDILFCAGIHPKRKIGTLNEMEKEKLLSNVILVLKDMIAAGGRDTEKDIFGNAGGYKVLMSKKTVALGCPKCGNQITKEAYLGGSVYYCSQCQPL